MHARSSRSGAKNNDRKYKNIIYLGFTHILMLNTILSDPQPNYSQSHLNAHSHAEYFFYNVSSIVCTLYSRAETSTNNSTSTKRICTILIWHPEQEYDFTQLD
jgi:hypothetical protein